MVWVQICLLEIKFQSHDIHKTSTVKTVQYIVKLDRQNFNFHIILYSGVK